MSGLLEKDPRIEQVIDKRTGRNLLDPTRPDPLVLDLTAGRPQRFALTVKNGQEGLIELAVSVDESWLYPENNRMTLVGGESGDCLFSANVNGTADMANVLFSWEGHNSTLCQSLVVMRRLPGRPDTGGTQTTTQQPAQQQAPQQQAPQRSEVQPPPGPERDRRREVIDMVVRFIDACGGPDKFIDVEEEHKIFRKGGDLGLTLYEIESILNRRCGEGGWTRQTRLTEKMTAMLREATKDDGVIDEGEFEHIVNFAVKRMMPRRAADEHCVILMLDNAWKPKQSFLNKWFDKKRKQYGL